MVRPSQVILFLAKQGSPFRGDVEDVSMNRNPGNFLVLLKSYAETDPTLSKHLYHPTDKNATYISAQSQNDIINVIAYDIILACIVDEMKSSQFFTVIADDVSNHNVDHLPVCLRFINKDCNIREEFISHMKLERV